MGKRGILAELLFRTGAINGLSRILSHNKIVILNYHRVCPDQRKTPTPFHDGLFTVGADEFYRQMSWLKRHTNILSEQDILDIAYRGGYEKSRLKCPSVAITFDDGYYDNYAVAYPILKTLKIPAFFFICTGMVWERRLLWWDILAFLIKNCRKHSIFVDEREYVLDNNRSGIIDELQLKMKQCSHEQIVRHIMSISAATEIELPPEEMQDKEIMTVEQIREMASNEMAIGSHTHTHRSLAMSDSSRHETELTVSKQLLEKTTSRPVHSVSYPYGLDEYIPPSIREIAVKCGYQLGFSSSFGVNYLNNIDGMTLKRFSGELEKVSHVSLLATWPELFTY